MSSYQSSNSAIWNNPSLTNSLSKKYNLWPCYAFGLPATKMMPVNAVDSPTSLVEVLLPLHTHQETEQLTLPAPQGSRSLTWKASWKIFCPSSHDSPNRQVHRPDGHRLRFSDIDRPAPSGMPLFMGDKSKQLSPPIREHDLDLRRVVARFGLRRFPGNVMIVQKTCRIIIGPKDQAAVEAGVIRMGFLC